MPETTSCSGSDCRFGDLRGVQWRINLGILPSPSASVEHLRRVTANSRRRYAALRRQLLVDPHVPKDGSNSPDLVIDNPLSQNPDSMWGRFFRNAELERMVDQDLTRLYPERGSYFQTSACQGILRRILLLWCLRHPDYGYRQGMHELLAPLLYVLHVDTERLSEVRKVYDDYFADKFDGFSFHENDLTYKFDFKKSSEYVDYENGFENCSTKATTPSELGPEIQNIVLLSDAYGAEGELGIVLSEKFMEHDAYSMFDALMSGPGVVSMSAFFSSSFKSPYTGYPPVIEASAAIYHLLSIVDISLHSHLIELGVEPQYFALRWLRVLFGREFSLEDLLVIWDEIFARENMKISNNSDAESNFGLLESPRGAFITSLAVSMILNMRSSLLATENATACLQRLLNFPDDVNLVKLLEKAKSLQAMAVNVNNSNFPPIHLELFDGKKPVITRGHTLSLDSTSPRTPLIVPESYWEEKWRVEQSKVASEEQVPNRKKGWSERVKLRLSRTESDPTPVKKNERTKIPKPSVRRSLLSDLAKQLGFDEDKEKTSFTEDVEPQDPVEVNGQDVIDGNSGNNTLSGEENSSNLSESPIHENGDEHENESGTSSVASSSLIDENDAESCGTNQEYPTLPESYLPDNDLSSKCTKDDDFSSKCTKDDDFSSKCTKDDDFSSKCTKDDDQVENLEKGVKDRKLLSGKFQWLWKFGRNAIDVTSEKKSAPEEAKTCISGSVQNSVIGVCAADGTNNGADSSSGTSKGESVDQNLMGSLKNLGQSMLENIQVIEHVFQQDRGQMENLSKNGIVGKGQVTAMAALKELRKISNLLSEM